MAGTIPAPARATSEPHLGGWAGHDTGTGRKMVVVEGFGEGSVNEVVGIFIYFDIAVIFATGTCPRKFTTMPALYPNGAKIRS